MYSTCRQPATYSQGLRGMLAPGRPTCNAMHGMLKRGFCFGAGVATAFAAPIGGLLFTIEEGASFYSTSIFWRSFLSTCIGVLTLHFLVSCAVSSAWSLTLCMFRNILWQLHESLTSEETDLATSTVAVIKIQVL